MGVRHHRLRPLLFTIQRISYSGTLPSPYRNTRMKLCMRTLGSHVFLKLSPIVVLVPYPGMYPPYQTHPCICCGCTRTALYPVTWCTRPAVSVIAYRVFRSVQSKKFKALVREMLWAEISIEILHSSFSPELIS